MWVCDKCSSAAVMRLERKLDESPPEQRIRSVLATLNVKAFAEYRLEDAIYDFAIPSLKLLIELDSPTYHSSHRRRNRDAHKSTVAARHDWQLERVIKGPAMASEVVKLVHARAYLLGMKA